MKARILRIGLPLALLVSGLTLQGQAQDPDIKQKFTQAQQNNTAALHQFTWKSRTELKLKGESKKVKLDQVRYDAQGQQQKTSLDDSSQQAAAQQQQGGGGRRGGRLKQKIVEKKKEEFAELMQDLVKLVTSYAHIPPEQMQAFVKGAQFSMGQGPYEGTLLIVGQNALQPGDSMKIWIHKQTLMMRRVEIETALEKKPVHLVADYKEIPQGPTYQSHVTLEYPEKQLQVLIDNYEHQPMGQ